ncbi:MAG: hypothetical protein LH469_12720 [Frankiaceae bacterium]|nr:hypothetical protein [Frankiaceae bacterium]
MSKQRQRRRAALEAKRHKPGAKKAKVAGAKQAAAQRTAAPKRAPKGRAKVYRQRRFKPLPMALKVALAVGWLVGAAAILLLTPTWTGRIGFLVILTMLLPLIVVIVRDPTRRTR